jgi:hypothetical protein
MKIFLKLMLPLILTFSILSNAQANNKEKNPVSTNDVSLINEWGDSALTFNALDKDYDLEALGFPVSNESVSPFNPSLMNKPETQTIQVVFDNKYFSAQSGFSNKAVDQVNEHAFFIQGSYTVLQQENFTLLVTAKIESLNEHSIYQFYSNDFVSRESSATKINGSKSYARFGILGQYSISNNWYLSGGVTSMAHEGSSSSQPVYNMKKEQVALFGTTYTF